MNSPKEAEVVFVREPVPTEHVSLYLTFGMELGAEHPGMDYLGCDTSYDAHKMRLDTLISSGQFVDLETREITLRRPIGDRHIYHLPTGLAEPEED